MSGSLPPLAHETWFVPGPGETAWAFAAQSLSLALLLGAVVATLLVRAVNARWSGLEVPFLARMAPFMPFAVRLHLAVSLIGLLSLGFFLSPAMDLQDDVVGILLGAVMAVVAIGLATGWHARPAAWLLIAAGPLGMLEFGLWEVLQRIDLLGLAVFVLLAGPGRWSADYELGRAPEPRPAAAGQAIWALRVAAGVALIVVAFVEKLANPDLALALLAERPELNVVQAVGLGLSDLEFTRLAAPSRCCSACSSSQVPCHSSSSWWPASPSTRRCGSSGTPSSWATCPSMGRCSSCSCTVQTRLCAH